MRRGLAGALALLALLASPAASRQAANDPAECPYCGGDPARLQAAGLVSHGGFGFARIDTARTDALLPDLDIYWLESKHFEIGLGIGPSKVGTKEKKKVRAELTRLAEVLPAVKPRAKVLDPWLRVHLYAQRLEDTYAEMLRILQVEEDVFPDGTGTWLLGTPYWGEGPHLGQKGKYEVLLVPSADDQVTFLRDQFGLSVRHTQKWNIKESDSLSVVINLTEDDIHGDEHIHNHTVFNVVHNLVDGFKHYSYDTPLYLKEGLAHWFERELNPDFNSFSFSEGGIAKKVTKGDWDTAVAKLVQRDEAPRLAELVNLDGFAEYEPRHHLACWSITAFFLERYPDAYAQLTQALHGRKAANGDSDGSDMRDAHRSAIKAAFGKSYAQIDAEWRAWALER